MTASEYIERLRDDNRGSKDWFTDEEVAKLMEDYAAQKVKEAGESRTIIDASKYYDAEKMYAEQGLKLVETCGACPEQYEVFTKEGIQVGYLRLRHGTFRVDYPACGDETIYTAYPKGDGLFEEDERMEYLAKALVAIRSRL